MKLMSCREAQNTIPTFIGKLQSLITGVLSQILAVQPAALSF